MGVRFRFRKIIVVVLFFTFVGCSTTTVHVNQLYLSPEEATAIKTALEQKGFKVALNRLTYPSDIQSSSILFSPFVEDKKAILKIEETLKNLDYDIGNVLSLVASNHWYTKNTIGLYIVPDGVNPSSGKTVADIAHVYQSKSCEKSSTLSLYNNGTFEYNADDAIVVSGSWSIASYPYILLENEEPYVNFYYEVFEKKHKTPTRSIELKPLSSSRFINQCHMQF